MATVASGGPLLLISLLLFQWIAGQNAVWAQTSYVNDSYYHYSLIRRHCPCSSAIHPQARYCGADIVILGLLKQVHKFDCNFTEQRSKSSSNKSMFSCTDLHFNAQDILHVSGRVQRRPLLRRAIESVRARRKVVLTIPKSSISTCNFKIRPVLGQRYVVSANFFDKRWFTYDCYHVFERWRNLTVPERKAYTHQYYERGCGCQIVQSTSISRFDWPRRPGSTPRNRQCWWNPGSSDQTGEYDSTAFCGPAAHKQNRSGFGSGSGQQCQWYQLSKSIPRSQQRTWSLRKPSLNEPNAISTMSNEVLLDFN